ncbi:MAG: type II secretion system protein M [Rhizobacter sp.]
MSTTVPRSTEKWQSLVAAWSVRSEPARRWWQSLAPREQRGLMWALSAMILLVVVMVLIRPAWRTLQEAPKQLAAVEGQLQQMKQLAREAQELRATPAVSLAQSTDALKASTDRLGAVARLNLQGAQASVTFNGVTPEAFTEWLREVRTVARVRISEAQLARTGTTYSGTVLVTLGGAAP